MKFKIDLKILFFLVLFYLTNQLNLYILVILFCFIHECAHIILGIILGFKIEQIELMPFGFFCNLKANIKDYNKKILKSNMVELKKIFITIAGPLMNIFLIVIFWLTYCIYRFDNVNVMIYSNLLICVFNLIPIFPLDGGRILKSLFRILFGNRKADKIMNIVSNMTIILLTAISSILILYLKNICVLIILIYLWYLVIRENKKYNVKSNIYRALDKI